MSGCIYRYHILTRCPWLLGEQQRVPT